MRNLVLGAFEITLWLAMAVSVVVGAVTGGDPLMGAAIGFLAGAVFTGFGFLLISINSHLAGIRTELQAQRQGTHDPVIPTLEGPLHR